MQVCGICSQHLDSQGVALPAFKQEVVVSTAAIGCMLLHGSCLQGGQGGADLYSDSVKKYRQSIFKLNYKLKKTKQNQRARHKIVVPQNAAEQILADHKNCDAVQ